jgi:predicted amidohydrolase YtcJ
MDEARKLAGKDAKVMDYGDNFIYPGFMEAHAHGVFAGYNTKAL